MSTVVPGEVLPTGPAPDGNDTDFWKSLRDGRLVLPRCADCGEWRALGRPICASCWSFATTWSEVDHAGTVFRSEEHTSELQSLMRISYAVFCLKKKTHK